MRQPLRWTRLAGLVLAAALSGCNCGGEGDTPSLTTFFTDVQYTPDGQSLILEGSDGLYVASPPTDPPRLATAEHCRSSQSGSLDCIRVAADSSRVAVLSNPKRDLTWDLSQFGIADFDQPNSQSWLVPRLPGAAITKVYDAQWSPDGSHLVYAKPGPEAATIGLFRIDDTGQEEELVRSINIGDASPSDAARAFIVTPYGVAYPRRTSAGVEIWNRPWDHPYTNIGRVRQECGGTDFRSCVLMSPDGQTLAWQENDTYVIHVYRTQKELDLPLGQGYGFNFTRTGNVALRMDLGPTTAYIQNVDTAAVVRAVSEASSAELSPDGDHVAYLKDASHFANSATLFVGNTRDAKDDREYQTFAAPPVRPLIGQNISLGGVDHSFSGNGHYVVIAGAAEDGKSAKLTAVNAETSETVDLDTLACPSCCVTAPAGALLMCLPTLTGGPVTAALPIDIYDLQTGKKTRATEKAIDLQFINDGSGVVVLELKTTSTAELFAAMHDGKVNDLGPAGRFAVSPIGGQVAILSLTGSLKVTALP